MFLIDIILKVVVKLCLFLFVLAKLLRQMTHLNFEFVHVFRFEIKLFFHLFILKLLFLNLIILLG